MKKTTIITLAALALLSSCRSGPEDWAAYVNPFIGTDFHGHTFPGPTVPFGLVQLSPDTRLSGWDGCSGYHYSDTVIYGFSHTHLSGTGVSDYGDILLIPTSGPGQFSNDDYSSPFAKTSEHAEAGYYRVFLDKPRVLAELTAGTRFGLHRYTFPSDREAHLVLDLEHRDQVLESWLEAGPGGEVLGYRRSRAWAEDQRIYFALRFSRPVLGLEVENPESDPEQTRADIQAWLDEARPFKSSGLRIKASFTFSAENRPLLVKVGLSAVSAAGALANLDREMPDWDFTGARHRARALWNRELGKIEVSGGSREQLVTFYSALYHCFIHPNVFNDADGSYRAADNSIRPDPGHDYYTVFSLWDTYRALHPLLTIIDTRRSLDFIKTFLAIYQARGLLPVWELAGNETFCMIGYHSVSVIADAWFKGIRDFDAELALRAMKTSANMDHFGLDAYRRHGHIAADMYHEGVSKTLEYAYNDWCIARFAADLGELDDYRTFIERAQYYKNTFDPDIGFMRPRLNGGWKTPFDPSEVDFNFTEANSWQYSFYVPQDISGLIAGHGGKQALAGKLDLLFSTKDPPSGRKQADITGLIGQYAHGNEPSHHIAYLYNFVNQPWKTQQTVRRIMDELYSSEPDGLSGNEDCGQMSAWLVLSALGFYQVTPGEPWYVIGTPWFKKAVINLENGRRFRIRAPKVSPENIYVQDLKLNGETWPESILKHADIMAGGELLFSMGPKPNYSWAGSDRHAPKTEISDFPITVVPTIMAAGPVFTDSLQVTMRPDMPQDSIRFTLDGSEPGPQSALYSEPLLIKENTRIKALALNPAGQPSRPMRAVFHRIHTDRSIEIHSQYNRQYTAGGPAGLIDGLRGAANFRLGGWQGYQDQDFEAVIDLGREKAVRRLAAGFLQDTRSWIILPTGVEFWISSDGTDYRRIAQVSHQVPAGEMEPLIVDLEARVREKGRWVKVIARNYGALPEWHLGAGHPAFIFIDEIIIE